MVSTRRTADFAAGRSDSVAGGPRVSGRRRAVAGTAVQSKLAISPEAPEAPETPEASVPAPRGARTKVREVTASSDVSAGRIVETGGEGDDGEEEVSDAAMDSAMAGDDIDFDWLSDDEDYLSDDDDNDDNDEDNSDNEERPVFDEDEEAKTHQEFVDDKPQSSKPGSRVVSFEPLPKALFTGPADDTNVKSFQQLFQSLLQFHHSSALTSLKSKLSRFQSGVTLDGNKWFCEKSVEDRFAECLEMIPAPVQSILGKPNLAPSDLLELPLLSPNYPSWGVYLNVATTTRRPSNRQSQSSLQVEGLYVGSSVASIGYKGQGVLGRVRCHLKVSEKDYSSVSDRLKCRHYALICRKDVTPNFRALALSEMRVGGEPTVQFVEAVLMEFLDLVQPPSGMPVGAKAENHYRTHYEVVMTTISNARQHVMETVQDHHLPDFQYCGRNASWPLFASFPSDSSTWISHEDWAKTNPDVCNTCKIPRPADEKGPKRKSKKWRGTEDASTCPTCIKDMERTRRREYKRSWRHGLTEDKREAYRVKHRASKAQIKRNRRANMTADEKAALNERQATRSRAKRAAETMEERKARLAINKQKRDEKKAKMTEEELEAARARANQQRAANKAKMTDEQLEAEKEHTRAAMARSRAKMTDQRRERRNEMQRLRRQKAKEEKEAKKTA